MRLFIQLLTALIYGLCAVNPAAAYLLEEQVLETPNQKCKIYYLTEKNTYGWHIETDREECGADKLLKGYHNITIYNAFSKPVEKLYGYFSGGYWTGDSLLPNIDLKRFSDELGVQKATFTVFNDSENNIFYIGQMSSKKASSGIYPPFKICGPFRILGIISDTSRLNNPHFLQTVFKTVERQTRRFCPTESEVQLYLSDTDNPASEEVYMYVQMDLKTHHHKIMRSPKASKQSLKQPGLFDSANTEEEELYQTLLPFIKQARRKSALYRALSIDPDEEITSETAENNFASQHKEQEETLKEPAEKAKPQPPIPEEFTPDLKIEQNSAVSKNENADSNSPAAYFDSAKPVHISENQSDSKDFIPPAPQKSYLMPLKPQLKTHVIKNGLLDISDITLPLPHILLLVRVLNVKVKAQTPLLIQNNAAHIQNTTVTVSGKALNGWYFIHGIFSQKGKNRENILLQPQKIQFCNKTYCEKEL